MALGGIQQRIKKMKEAIKNQARQRANNIVEKAQEESDIQRIKIIKTGKQKIDLQFQHDVKNQKVKAKIQKSSLINKERIKKMQSRYLLIQKLKQILKQRLKHIVNDHQQYKILVSQFILQGMLRMMERNIYVETKSEHSDLIKQVFPRCQRQFHQIILRETGKQMNSHLQISQYFLQTKHKNIIGGVFLRNNDGLIVCNNSLDARIQLIFQHLLPVIRSMLFKKDNEDQSLI